MSVLPYPLEAHVQLCFQQGVSLQLPAQTCLLLPVPLGELDPLSKGGNQVKGNCGKLTRARTRGRTPSQQTPVQAPLRVSVSGFVPPPPTARLSVLAFASSSRPASRRAPGLVCRSVLSVTPAPADPPPGPRFPCPAGTSFVFPAVPGGSPSLPPFVSLCVPGQGSGLEATHSDPSLRSPHYLSPGAPVLPSITPARSRPHPDQ